MNHKSPFSIFYRDNFSNLASGLQPNPQNKYSNSEPSYTRRRITDHYNDNNPHRNLKNVKDYYNQYDKYSTGYNTPSRYDQDPTFSPKNSNLPRSTYQQYTARQHGNFLQTYTGKFSSKDYAKIIDLLQKITYQFYQNNIQKGSRLGILLYSYQNPSNNQLKTGALLAYSGNLTSAPRTTLVPVTDLNDTPLNLSEIYEVEKIDAGLAEQIKMNSFGNWYPAEYATSFSAGYNSAYNANKHKVWKKPRILELQGYLDGIRSLGTQKNFSFPKEQIDIFKIPSYEKCDENYKKGYKDAQQNPSIREKYTTYQQFLKEIANLEGMKSALWDLYENKPFGYRTINKHECCEIKLYAGLFKIFEDKHCNLLGSAIFHININSQKFEIYPIASCQKCFSVHTLYPPLKQKPSTDTSLNHQAPWNPTLPTGAFSEEDTKKKHDTLKEAAYAGNIQVVAFSFQLRKQFGYSETFFITLYLEAKKQKLEPLLAWFYSSDENLKFLLQHLTAQEEVLTLLKDVLKSNHEQTILTALRFTKDHNILQQEEADRLLDELLIHTETPSIKQLINYFYLDTPIDNEKTHTFLLRMAAKGYTNLIGYLFENAEFYELNTISKYKALITLAKNGYNNSIVFFQNHSNCQEIGKYYWDKIQKKLTSAKTDQDTDVDENSFISINSN